MCFNPGVTLDDDKPVIIWFPFVTYDEATYGKAVGVDSKHGFIIQVQISVVALGSFLCSEFLAIEGWWESVSSKDLVVHFLF